MRVPTIPIAVTRTSRATLSPACEKHTTDVVDAHADVPQLVVPIVAVGVTAPAPKFTPLTVTLYPADVAALASATKLTTGAAPVVVASRMTRQLQPAAAASLQPSPHVGCIIRSEPDAEQKDARSTQMVG